MAGDKMPSNKALAHGKDMIRGRQMGEHLYLRPGHLSCSKDDAMLLIGNAHRPANPVGHDGYEARGFGDDGSMSRSASSVMNLVSTAEFELPLLRPLSPGADHGFVSFRIKYSARRCPG
uniref:Uncharacterized protein n=1 Tax=Coccidioides posadasii RMSCC 3488 TaxID=454284 RepID=A0A0J6F0K8_COCPO|nr:hypothetical protein CPAG_02750 [Coccidioides posadasii RMSCC 3488]